PPRTAAASERAGHRRQREAAPAYARSLTPGERIMHAGRAFAQSIGSGAADFVAGLPVLAKTIDDILAHAPVITPRGGSDKIMAQRTRFIQAAQAIRGWAERTFPTDPNLQHAFLETLLPQGLGSFTTYLGVSAAGTAVGGPVGG